LAAPYTSEGKVEHGTK